jgi:predicted secreted hydrolase
MTFTSQDDALHPFESPEYYEWWYYDARLDNGYTCILAFMWRDIAMPRVPVIELELYAPDGSKVHDTERYAIKDATASTVKCDATIGTNRVWQEDADTFRIAVKTAHGGADLAFRRSIPGLKLSPSGLIVDDATGKQGWVNACPRASVEGTLDFKGKLVTVKGVGYHDHNWGNVDMGRSMGGWVWGRMFDPKYTFVYGWLLPLGKDETVNPFVYLARGSQPIFGSSEMQLTTGGVLDHRESGNKVPEEMTMRGEAGGVKVDIRLKMTRLMDWQKVEQAVGYPMYYYRRQLSYEADIVIGAEKDKARGEAIDEYVLIKSA